MIALPEEAVDAVTGHPPVEGDVFRYLSKGTQPIILAYPRNIHIVNLTGL